MPYPRLVTEVHFRDILRIKDSHPIAFKQWIESMEAEIKSLNDQKVWELVDLPPNQKPIKCRWVYDVKSDGHKKG